MYFCGMFSKSETVHLEYQTPRGTLDKLESECEKRKVSLYNSKVRLRGVSVFEKTQFESANTFALSFRVKDLHGWSYNILLLGNASNWISRLSVIVNEGLVLL